MTGATTGRHNDRPDRSRLQISVGCPQQRRLRPPSCRAASTGTADLVWSKTVKDIKSQNLNFVQIPGATGIGGRPMFTRKVAYAQRRHPARRTPTKATPGTWPTRYTVPSPTDCSCRAPTPTASPEGTSWMELPTRRRRTRDSSRRPWQPERRAAGAVEFRSRSPDHADGELRDPVLVPGDQAGCVVLLLGPVGPTLHADLQQRRRTATTAGPTICSISRRRRRSSFIAMARRW